MSRVAIGRRAFGQAAASDLVDHYRTLGVQRDADLRTIKAKYRDLAKRYHPDVYRGDQQVFRQVQAAYRVLASPRQRMAYDQTLPTSGTSHSQNNSDENEDLSDDYKAKATSGDFYKDLNSVKRERRDVESEHAKFFSKKMTTDFGQTQVQEDQAVAGFSKEDKARAQFVADRTESKFSKLQKGNKREFDQTIEETIEILNEDTKPKRKARLIALARAKGLRIGFTKLLTGVGVFSLITVLLLGWEVRKWQSDQVKDQEAKADRIEREMKSRQLKNQMVFD